jgi:hypothetical protein
MAEYKCEECGNVVEAKEAPGCCGQTMIPATEGDDCVQPQNPEARRFSDQDESCDDGRSGL